ncbi:hypothetical protein B0H66DRAFT_527245 [Apodospora peruviana]|uniref:Uncharacterized protein n=1 Tax=Apodospora peruviana TaxID=516989 RepID=A0AAE0MFK5_9PEZI|nr:hypothetical protein B0H66DRAFT_527245 [Apodospora peruviana]
MASRMEWALWLIVSLLLRIGMIIGSCFSAGRRLNRVPVADVEMAPVTTAMNAVASRRVQATQPDQTVNEEHTSAPNLEQASAEENTQPETTCTGPKSLCAQSRTADCGNVPLFHLPLAHSNTSGAILEPAGRVTYARDISHGVSTGPRHHGYGHQGSGTTLSMSETERGILPLLHSCGSSNRYMLGHPFQAVPEAEANNDVGCLRQTASPSSFDDYYDYDYDEQMGDIMLALKPYAPWTTTSSDPASRVVIARLLEAIEREARRLSAFQTRPCPEIQAMRIPPPHPSEPTKKWCIALMRKLARTLLLAMEDIDSTRAVNSYRVDSLVGVEIRTGTYIAKDSPDRSRANAASKKDKEQCSPRRTDNLVHGRQDAIPDRDIQLPLSRRRVPKERKY